MPERMRAADLLVVDGPRLRLTAAQAGLWFAQQADPANPVYNIAECVSIDGPVDAGKFERALRRVVEETDALRARFGTDETGPWQIVEPEVAWTFHHVDVSAAANPETAARDWMRTASAEPVDLTTGPLF